MFFCESPTRAGRRVSRAEGELVLVELAGEVHGVLLVAAVGRCPARGWRTGTCEPSTAAARDLSLNFSVPAATVIVNASPARSPSRRR
jgi:hypothetical protein